MSTAERLPITPEEMVRTARPAPVFTRRPVSEAAYDLLLDAATELRGIADAANLQDPQRAKLRAIADRASALFRESQPAPDGYVLIAVPRRTADNWRGIVRAAQAVALRGAVYSPGSVHNAAALEAEDATRDVAYALARAIGDEPTRVRVAGGEAG